MRIFLILAFLLFSFLEKVNAQINELPVHFGQYFNNPQINPAIGGARDKFIVFSGNKRNLGNFGGIKTSYISAFYRFKKNKDGFHSIGASFNNDREGTSIARNRAYISYARHQRVSKLWMLSSGFSGGVYTFSVKSNPVIGGASSSVLDLNLGVFLYSNLTSVSFSINQLNRGKVKPFNQIIELIPQYNLIIEQKIKVNQNLSIQPSCFYKYANLGFKELNTRLGIGLTALLINKINVGTSYEAQEGVYAFLGLHNIELNSKFSEQKIDIDFSYFLPNVNNTRTNINAYELTLKYYFNKKKK